MESFFFWRPINLWKRFIFHSDSCSDWMPLSGANVPVLLSQLTDTLNSCMVRISLHSMEEINDCNSTLLREGTFFLGGGGLGPQRGGSSVKVSTKRGGPYLM